MPNIEYIVDTLMEEIVLTKAYIHPGYTKCELDGITYELGFSDNLTRAFFTVYNGDSMHEEIIQISGLDDETLRLKLQGFIISIESKRKVNND